MPIVVKWRLDGSYLRGFRDDGTTSYTMWTHVQSKAKRFCDREAARAHIATHGGDILIRDVKLVRLVPRRHADKLERIEHIHKMWRSAEVSTWEAIQKIGEVLRKR